MSDLISRQTVLEALRNVFDKYNLSWNPSEKRSGDFAGEVPRVINNIPTAYDVDKVVEQIQNVGTSFCTNTHCNTECSDCDHGVMMRSVINTVKAGGVNG